MKTFVEWLTKLAENDPGASDMVNQWKALRQKAGWEKQTQDNLTQTDDQPGAGAARLYNPSVFRAGGRNLGPTNRIRTSPLPGGAPQTTAPSYMKKRMQKR